MTSHLERELRDQPAALARLIDKQLAYAEEIAGLFRRSDVQYVLIASRGSSSNAARYAQYLLGRAHRVPVAFATPSLFTLYGQPPRLDGALVVGISQSGESPDVVEVVREAQRQGRPSIAVTNSPSSPLGLAADAVVKLEAGKEQAVAATKTYVNSLGAIALIFATTTGDAKALEERRQVPRDRGRIERSGATSRDWRFWAGRGGPWSRADHVLHLVRGGAEDPRAVGAALRGVLVDPMHGLVAAIGQADPSPPLLVRPGARSDGVGRRRRRPPRRPELIVVLHVALVLEQARWHAVVAASRSGRSPPVAVVLVSSRRCGWRSRARDLTTRRAVEDHALAPSRSRLVVVRTAGAKASWRMAGGLRPSRTR